jgi:hypothetical protein
VTQQAMGPQVISDVLQTARGRGHRDDPVLARTGGPAGNAQLTAWLGLVLLALFLAELVTLLDVKGLISWHIGLGLLLIPPALAKTASTGWRILRYYAGAQPYVQAGPPPLLLRLLGPLVIVGTLAVLGTGVALIALGPTSGRQTWFSLLGFAVSPLTLHQASFIVWAVATGLHVLTRLVPAWQRATRGTGREGLPGQSLRGLAIVISLALAAVVTLVVLAYSGSWTNGDLRDHQGPGRTSSQGLGG